jgi:hypothetical protein
MHKSIGIGILSWRAHQTLKYALNSYSDDFLKIFDQRLIYFSDISEDDKQIARDYGWEFAGGPNEGIAGGMKRLAENMKTDYILLLQNDNPLIEPAEFAHEHLCQAVDYIDKGEADLARMRHRWQVGDGFACVTKYLKYYKPVTIAKEFILEEHDISSLKPSKLSGLQRFMKPHNAKRFQGRSIYIEENPEALYPNVINKLGDFLRVDSAALDFTDQCLLISHDQWLNLFMPFVESNPSSRKPNGYQAPEICINSPWWRESGFKILQGRGLFTHARKDDSFRMEHPLYKIQKTA